MYCLLILIKTVTAICYRLTLTIARPLAIVLPVTAICYRGTRIWFYCLCTLAVACTVSVPLFGTDSLCPASWLSFACALWLWLVLFRLPLFATDSLCPASWLSFACALWLWLVLFRLPQVATDLFLLLVRVLYSPLSLRSC